MSQPLLGATASPLITELRAKLPGAGGAIEALDIARLILAERERAANDPGESEQFKAYAAAIGRGEFTAGMADQIDADERLHDGEVERLLAMADAAMPPLVANDVAVPLEPLLVQWKPRFRSSIQPQYRTLPKRNRDEVYAILLQQYETLSLTANARMEGDLSKAAPWALEQLRMISGMREAGYEPQRVQLAGFNQLALVFVKDGLAVTPQGAAKLATNVAGKNVPGMRRASKREAMAAYDDLSYSIDSYSGSSPSELLRVADLDKRIGKKVEAVRYIVERGWPEGAISPDGVLERAQVLVDQWNKLRADGLTDEMGRGEAESYLRVDKGLNPEQVDAILTKPSSEEVITLLGEEIRRPSYTVDYLNEAAAAALAAAAGGNEPAGGEADSEVYVPAGNVTPAGTVAAAEDPAMTADRAFLQTVIDGTADVMDDTTQARIMEMAVKYEGHEGLAETLGSALQAFEAKVMALAQEAMKT